MILAIDTSGSVCAVAAAKSTLAEPATASDQPTEVLFARAGTRPRAHAEELAPLVNEAMTCGQVQQVVVGRGPGSFTGLRVGLATAQVLGWALAVPVVGVCTLDVVACQSELADGWVVMDARRGELFHQRYAAGNAVGLPDVAPRADVRRLVGTDRVAGDVALLESVHPRDFGVTRIDPTALAQVAVAAVGRGLIEPPTPLYLRRPDVTMTATNVPGNAI